MLLLSVSALNAVKAPKGLAATFSSSCAAAFNPTPVRINNQVIKLINLVLLLATACGTAAANLYYAQPLLHTLSRAFSVSTGTSGLIVTISQIGYVLGLAFVLPLGDLL